MEKARFFDILCFLMEPASFMPCHAMPCHASPLCVCVCWQKQSEWFHQKSRKFSEWFQLGSIQKSYRIDKEQVRLSSRIHIEMQRSERPNELIGAFLKQLVWTDVLHICFTFICTCPMWGVTKIKKINIAKNIQNKIKKKKSWGVPQLQCTK